MNRFPNRSLSAVQSQVLDSCLGEICKALLESDVNVKYGPD